MAEFSFSQVLTNPNQNPIVDNDLERFEPENPTYFDFSTPPAERLRTGAPKNTKPVSSNKIVSSSAEIDGSFPVRQKPITDPYAAQTPHTDLQQRNTNEHISIINEVGRSLLYGGVEMLNNIGSLPSDVAITSAPLWDIETKSFEPRTTAGYIGSFATQFFIPYAGVVKALTLGSKLTKLASLAVNSKNLARMGTLSKYALAEGITSALVFEPKDPNLSNLLQELSPEMSQDIVNAITQYTAMDMDDTRAEGRLKNALEGIIGAAALPAGWTAGKIVTSVTKHGFKKAGEGAGAAHRYIGSPLTKFRESGERAIFNDSSKHPWAWAARLRNAYINKGSGYERVDNAYKVMFDKLDDKEMLDAMQHYDRAMSASTFTREFINNGTFTLDPVNGQLVHTGDGYMNIVKELKNYGDQTFNDFKDLLKYTRARSLEKVNNSPIPASETAENLARLQDTFYYPKLVELMEKHKTFTDNVLEFAKKAGILSSDEISYMKAYSDVFVPFYRVKDNAHLAELLGDVSVSEARQVSKSQKALQGTTKPGIRDLLHKSMDDYSKMDDLAKAQSLAEEPIDDVLTNMMLYTNNIIELGLKNMAKRRLYDTLEEMGEAGLKYAERTQKTTKPFFLNKDTIASVMETLKKSAAERGINLNVTKQDILRSTPDQALTLFHRVADNAANVDVVHRIDPNTGKRVTELWTIRDPILQSSAASMGFKSAEMTDAVWRNLTSFAEKFKQLDQLTITANPNFFAYRMFLGDTTAIWMQAETKFIPVWDSLKGLMHGSFRSKMWEKFRQNGGTFGRHLFGDAERTEYTRRAIMAGEYLEQNKDWARTLAWPFRNLYHFTNEITEKFEYAGRLGYFMRLKEAGYSDAVAAQKAKEIAVNFSRHGASKGVQNLSRMVPFLNAQIQSIDRFMRATGAKALVGGKLTPSQSKTAKKLWTKIVGTAIFLDVALPYAYENGTYGEAVKNRWNSLPEYVKATHWPFIIPNINDLSGESNGPPTVWLMPKPFDFAVLGGMASATIDQMYNNPLQKDILFQYVTDVAQQWTRTGTSGFMPSIIQPWAEVATNSKFGERTIIPEHEEGAKVPRLVQNERDSEVAKIIADNIGESPTYIDHIVYNYFNSFGRLAFEYLFDPYLQKRLDLPKKPSKDIAERTLLEGGLRGIIAPDYYPYSDFEQQLYSQYSRQNIVEDLKKFANSENIIDQNVVKRMLEEPAFALNIKLQDYINKSVKTLNEMNAQIKKIYNTRTDPDLKRDQIRQIRKQKEELLLELARDIHGVNIKIDEIESEN